MDWIAFDANIPWVTFKHGDELERFVNHRRHRQTVVAIKRSHVAPHRRRPERVACRRIASTSPLIPDAPNETVERIDGVGASDPNPSWSRVTPKKWLQ